MEIQQVGCVFKYRYFSANYQLTSIDDPQLASTHSAILLLDLKSNLSCSLNKHCTNEWEASRWFVRSNTALFYAHYQPTSQTRPDKTRHFGFSV